MKNIITILLATAFLFQSCENKIEKQNDKFSTKPIAESNNKKAISVSDDSVDKALRKKLPIWLFDQNIISKGEISNKYAVDLRLKPIYIKEDFNGDNFEDIAFPIKELSSGKMGFVIIHGKTNEINIVGAGKVIKKALGDNMDYIDIWELSRENEVTGTDEDENGDLIETPVIFLKFPSIRIEKSELGGGLIFWNGKEYEYLHQTC